MTTRTYSFEGGSDGTPITTINSGVGTGNTAFNIANPSGSPVRVWQASGALKGALSGRITAPTAADTVSIGWDTTFNGVAGTGLTQRFYFKPLADTIANGAVFAVLRAASASPLALQFNTGLSFRMNDLTGAVPGTTYAMTVNTLYRIEVWGDPGTSTSSGQCHVWIYAGDSTTPLFDSGVVTGRNLGGATLVGFRFGHTGSVGTVDYLIDAIAVNDTNGSTPIGPLAANQAPTVSVTTPVTIVAGAAASLVSTESDPDGDATTGTWAYLSGPSVVAPAAPSSASTTVTLTTPGRYVYRRSVSDGNLTTNADCTIRVTTQPTQVDGTVSNAGGMTAVGSASLAAALADSNDGTYGESVSSPVNAVTVHSLAPFTTPTDKSGIKLVVRARRQGGTTGTSKFELMEGATVRKDFGTQTLTTSFADYTLALDLTSANAITDWSGLSVRQTDNAS